MEKVKETYSQLNERIQKEVNELPLYWAFGKGQWEELLEKLGISEDETSEKLVNGPAGSVIRKEDAELVVSTLKRHSQELEEALKDIDFFKEAVIYEMSNHEYHINGQGDYDVLTALGFTCEYENEIESSGMSKEQIKAYKDARREFFKMADENGWY